MSDEANEAPDEALEDSTEPEEKYRKLLAKVKQREKEFADGWWKDAEAAVKLYEGDRRNEDSSDQAYNILYSNTEVLVPSLYSATPKPDVRARYKKQEVKPVPDVVERFLTIVSDPSNPGSESLDAAMSETVLESLVAGMGFARLRHYPDKPMPICIEAGHYKGLIWGYARKWSKVPWIAFRHELTKEEIFSQFKIPGDKQIQFSSPPDDEGEIGAKDTKPNGAVVYEVWDRASKEICFICEDWRPILLQEGEDTMKLQGFYPTPGLLLMTSKPGKIVPIPLYQYYRNQAEELNRVTVRLNKVLSAIKVRGAYNTLLGADIEKILNDEQRENALVPASEAALLMQTGGFDRHIWLLPLEKLITVATQLYQARQQIKQVIYELTGISDIIRGSSVASETATAQDLKNKWGTIRLRKMQTLVADYVRDLYRLAVDGASQAVKPAQWKEITQLPFPTANEKKAAQTLLRQMLEKVQQTQAQYQQIAQQAQAMGQQPPPPPQLPQPPQQVVQAAQSPAWEEILSQIHDDANRTFIINVQTSSTIDLDTAADKEDVTEFMAAMGQLMPGLAPLTQLGPSGFEAAKAILISVCERFKFGIDVADVLKELQPPPQGADPAQLKQQQAEMEKKGQELEKAQEQIKTDSMKLKEQQMELEFARKEFDLQVKMAKAELQAEKAIMLANQKAQQVQTQAQQKQFETGIQSTLAQHDAQQQVHDAQQAASQQVSATQQKTSQQVFSAQTKAQESIRDSKQKAAQAAQKSAQTVDKSKK